MIDVSVFLWESIYALKEVYDHNPVASVLSYYKDVVLNGDYIYEIVEDSIGQFFADTRRYYDDENDLSVYVFFDPIITGFWKLCDEYETRLRIKPNENKYREEMERDLDSAMYIPDYSYDFKSYKDTTRKSGCRIVILCYCEFNGYQWIPDALNEAYDTFVYHTNQIKEAIAQLDQPQPFESEKEALQKEAA